MTGASVAGRLSHPKADETKAAKRNEPGSRRAGAFLFVGDALLGPAHDHEIEDEEAEGDENSQTEGNQRHRRDPSSILLKAPCSGRAGVQQHKIQPVFCIFCPDVLLPKGSFYVRPHTNLGLGGEESF